MTALRSQVAAFLDRPVVTRFILAVIIFNAVILGLETSKPVMAAAGGTILLLDKLCLTIFIVELALKLFAHGGRFFRSGWNLFDLAVVGVALLPSSGGLSVLRALRVLRVLRVISIAPSLRRVVEGFLRALPGMGSVALLIGLIYYISAVMATKLFAASFPEWFGDLGLSAYSLFQIMTLESWSMGIVRPVMEVYPYAWTFFVPFILATTFAVMNLLVGLIVNSMQEAASAEHEEAERDKHAELMARLDSIERRLSERG
jgi:voltage-gated sodium channel